MIYEPSPTYQCPVCHAAHNNSDNGCPNCLIAGPQIELCPDRFTGYNPVCGICHQRASA